MIVITLIE